MVILIILFVILDLKNKRKNKIPEESFRGCRCYYSFSYLPFVFLYIKYTRPKTNTITNRIIILPNA